MSRNVYSIPTFPDLPQLLLRPGLTCQNQKIDPHSEDSQQQAEEVSEARMGLAGDSVAQASIPKEM